MPSTDPDFIRYATTGDGDAFRALVSAHLGMVIAVAVRRLGPHAHLAPDVAQGVFTRLARVARGLPRDLIVAPWLHRQAVRLAIDAVRKEERRLRRETTAAMLYAPDSTPPPAETALLVDEALDQLPAADRTVLVLRYLEDRDFESVAQSLGSTPEAARKRIARSLEKLRALLTRRGTALSLTALTAFLTDQSAPAAPAALTARISASALQSAAAATGNTAAILTTALMSHAAALATGALAALLACGFFYVQREKEIAQHAGAVSEPSALSTPSALSGLSTRPTPPLPSTLPEIIAAIATLTDGPNTRAAQQHIAALLRRVPPEQYLEFYTTAESRIHPLRWQGLVEASVLLWTDLDPGAVTRALFDSDSRRTSLMREARVVRDVLINSFRMEHNREGESSISARIERTLEVWHQMDPAAAKAWLLSNQDAPLMKFQIGIGRTSLSQWLWSCLPADQPDCDRLSELNVTGLTTSQANSLRRKWIEQTVKARDAQPNPLTDSTSDLAELRGVAGQLALRSPDRCAACVESLSDPAARRAAALGYTSQHARETDETHTNFPMQERLARANWALKVCDGATDEAFLADITESVIGLGRKDESAPVREWLLKHMQQYGTGTRALMAGATTASQAPGGIDDALQWAAAIPDAAQRGPLLRGIYLRWQDADPAAAQKFLTTAPADIAAELQALTPEAP